jgi:hypothetical protein
MHIFVLKANYELCVSRKSHLLDHPTLLSISCELVLVKTTAHVHNYEHEQVPMVTDLHMRPVMGFLCLGTEAGGVYMRTLGAEIRHPHLATG